MRIFAIKNESDNNSIVAYLFYYEKEKKFYIELLDKCDEWNTPLLLSSFAKKNIKTINSYWSNIWVQQRIVPSDRQNIAQVLKDNKLNTYDEFKLLLLSNGRCAQDDFFLEEIKEEELPFYIRKRYDLRIDDVSALSDERLLVFFRNGDVRILETNRIIDKNSKLYKLINLHPEVFFNVRIQVGGYGVYWDENMYLTSEEIYANSKSINLKTNDINMFISSRVVNTAEACKILNCSRQYIEYLIEHKRIKPIKVTEKGKIFLKSDIEKVYWD